MNCVKLHSLSLNYQRFTQSSCNDIGIRKLIKTMKVPLNKQSQSLLKVKVKVDTRISKLES